MSIQYKVVKQVFNFDETKTEKYVVKTVTGEMLPFDKVRKQVCQITGSHRGTVNLVIDGLLDVLVNNLDMGHSVKLGEFGILRPGIRARAQDDEKEANANSIYRRKVNFVPGKMLKNFLKDVAVSRMTIPDTDFTDGSSGNNNPGNGNTGNGEIDPDA